MQSTYRTALNVVQWMNSSLLKVHSFSHSLTLSLTHKHTHTIFLVFSSLEDGTMNLKKKTLHTPAHIHETNECASTCQLVPRFRLPVSWARMNFIHMTIELYLGTGPNQLPAN
jgi:hypothetical protein